MTSQKGTVWSYVIHAYRYKMLENRAQSICKDGVTHFAIVPVVQGLFDDIKFTTLIGQREKQYNKLSKFRKKKM